MMKLLITGGGGFIGRNLAELLSDKYRVLAPSQSELNLLDANAVRNYLRANSFDAVVHAATTRANRRIGAPPDLLDRNCRMFLNLARNESLFGKMIHFGSGAEYGLAQLPPRVREEYFDTCVPTDPYGFSKYICAKIIDRSDRIVNLRLFGVFGKYEDHTVRFISNACCRVLKGLPIVIRRDVIFDYLYVGDLARITSWFVEHKSRCKAYNVARGEGIALSSLAHLVAEVSGRHPQIIVGDPGLAQEYSADNSLLLSEVSQYQFADTRQCIAELYEWYATREQSVSVDSLRFDEMPAS